MHLRVIWAIFCILCIFAQALDVLADNQPSTNIFPAVLLHLSDIHVSTNVELFFKKFGDRQGDLNLFSKYLLNQIAPGAIIITGDLTDSKDHAGAGIQQEIEWQGYRKILQDFTNLGGVPLQNILDHRGNHDGFNRAALRGSDVDYFTQYSASGIRGDAAKRVWTHLVVSSSSLEKKSQEGGSYASSLLTLEEWKANAQSNCPSALLIGLDFSEEPAFKNPLNFLGHAEADVVDEITNEVLEIKAELEHHHCFSGSNTSISSLPIISYGHYPLSSVHHHAKNRFKDIFLHAFQSGHSMQGAVQALADVGTTSYWSGHLHTEFGERLHRAHPLPSSSKQQKKTIKNSSKMLIELETGAWKDDRRFRIAALDGGAMSFIDLYLHTPSSPDMSYRRKDGPQRAQQEWVDHFKKTGWGVTVADADAFVVENVALLTWPVDARYSPQPAVEESSFERGTVRVLVFSLGKKKESAMKVELNGYLPDGTKLFSDISLVMDQQKKTSSANSSPKLFSATPAVIVACGETETKGECAPPATFIDVQITIKSTTATTTIEEVSQKWPVKLSCSPLPENNNQQQCWVAPTVDALAPMGLTWPERIGLLVNWPVIVHRVFLVLWASYVFLFLLLPRQFSKNKLLVTKLIRSINTRRNTNNLPSIFVYSPNNFITWPFKALVLCANVNSIWQPLFFYSLYLISFPLYFTYLHDDAASTIPAAIFSFGIFGKFASHEETTARWQFLASSDTIPVACANLVFGVVPLTLWIASVVGTHILEAHRLKTRKEKTRSLVTKLQLLSLFLIVFVNYMLIYRYVFLFLGPLSMILSPGLTWTTPLAVVLAASVVKSRKFEENVLVAAAVRNGLKLGGAAQTSGAGALLKPAGGAKASLPSRPGLARGSLKASAASEKEDNGFDADDWFKDYEIDPEDVDDGQVRSQSVVEQENNEDEIIDIMNKSPPPRPAKQPQQLGADALEKPAAAEYNEKTLVEETLPSGEQQQSTGDGDEMECELFAEDENQKEEEAAAASAKKTDASKAAEILTTKNDVKEVAQEKHLSFDENTSSLFGTEEATQQQDEEDEVMAEAPLEKTTAAAIPTAPQAAPIAKEAANVSPRKISSFEFPTRNNNKPRVPSRLGPGRPPLLPAAAAPSAAPAQKPAVNAINQSFSPLFPSTATQSPALAPLLSGKKQPVAVAAGTPTPITPAGELLQERGGAVITPGTDSPLPATGEKAAPPQIAAAIPTTTPASASAAATPPPPPPTAAATNTATPTLDINDPLLKIDFSKRGEEFLASLADEDAATKEALATPTAKNVFSLSTSVASAAVETESLAKRLEDVEVSITKLRLRYVVDAVEAKVKGAALFAAGTASESSGRDGDDLDVAPPPGGEVADEEAMEIDIMS